MYLYSLPQELINGENMVTAKKQMPQIVHLFNRKHKLFAETYITFPFLYHYLMKFFLLYV